MGRDMGDDLTLVLVTLREKTGCQQTNCTTTHYLLSNYVQIKTLRGTAKALSVDLLRLNTLKDTKTVF